MRSILRGLALVAAIIDAGCGSTPPSMPPTYRGADASSPDDPVPVLTSEQWSTLLTLSPDPLPAPPPDPTNRFADNSLAAALGQRFFFDPSFSGPLLDSDNTGGPQSLGKVGETGRVACAGCHLPATAFTDTRSFQRQISLGAGWGRRRAPSLLDVGQAKLIMWDGRRDTLYNQVFGPLESVVEMNSSRLYMAEQIFRTYKVDYEAIFGPMPHLDDASRFVQLSAQLTGCRPQNPTDPQPACNGPFHGMPGDHAEFDNLTAADQAAVTSVVVNFGKSIGAFERLLTCGAGPFDAWIHGKPTAISRAAQRGAGLFVGKAACVTCHSGPFLSDQHFHNVGLKPQVVQQAFIDTGDRGAATGIAAAIADPLNSIGRFSDGTDGRLPSAATAQMEGAFRTPTLRCLTLRPKYMHTGQVDTLAQVVAFFNQGGNAMGYPGASEIRALNLTALEQSDLVAFMRSLDGPGAAAKYQRAP